MPVAAGIGTRDDLDPSLERPLDRQEVVLIEVARPLADMRLRRFAVELVDQKRWDENDAARCHQVEVSRVLIEVTAMLDRIDAGFDRDVEASPAKRMAHHPPIKRMRLLDQRLYLVEIEGPIARSVPRPRAGAAGGRAFDEIGAGSHHAAH